MNIEQARFNMIEQQIRPWDVLDSSVLSLLAMVKREDFVPAAYRSMAFMDLEVPLPDGQCMLAPRVEARMLQELNVHKHEKVLEIGAGSGFMAALLAHKAQRVVSLEIRPELAALAAQNLRRAGITNAEVRQGDGTLGCSQDTPFDAIVLSGSVASVPDKLLSQLKPGGRLIAIVGQEPVMRAVLVTQGADGRFNSKELFDTVAPRLDGFGELSRFQF
ncbi:protein-L-isoaspartate O-methyltransferase [Aquabacterium sp.]|uniref:protein-L-isoaspartate O-methyltransferase family protein n=1 Tax=Aquabacterium sp. TaxID=1872578 RepID=UPI0035B3D4F1